MVPIEVRLVHYVGGFTEDTFKICKDYLRPFKKTLQRLNMPKDYPKERKLLSTRKNLNILGEHINMFLVYNCKSWEVKHWKKLLWRFVSLFSTLDEKQLYKLYRYSKTDQFTKFLKVYCCLEYADMVSLPSNKKWAKLRDRWRLASCGLKFQESCDFPERRMPMKRCSTIQGKRFMKQRCATCDEFDELSFTTNEETASSSSSILY
ncbi:CHD1 helical C-terminal domain containing protein 1 [Erythrolamprus reginae]|uniref:CHD1 helical C-terminal domain containing protein 1 n=1 Tax=Erythrolamprus reginae TaxID=121349 RepID=UPI00396C896C